MKLTFHIFSLFPEVLEPYLHTSILGRARKEKLFSATLWQIRDFAEDKHRKTDDKPYGGGPGLVMKAEPILSGVKKALGRKKGKVIVFSAQGKPFTNAVAKKLAKSRTPIVLICGRYEGIDARVTKALGAEEYSIGDYTLTGGELPALVVIDATMRQVPGVLGKSASLEESRTASKEVYTRPDVIEWKKKKYRVPKVLREGDHGKIQKWRQKKSVRRRG